MRESLHEHMQSSGGELKLWGKVQHCPFYYTEGQALVFSPQAVVVGEHDRRPDCASPGGVERLLTPSEDVNQV